MPGYNIPSFRGWNTFDVCDLSDNWELEDGWEWDVLCLGFFAFVCEVAVIC